MPWFWRNSTFDLLQWSITDENMVAWQYPTWQGFIGFGPTGDSFVSPFNDCRWALLGCIRAWMHLASIRPAHWSLLWTWAVLQRGIQGWSDRSWWCRCEQGLVHFVFCLAWGGGLCWRGFVRASCVPYFGRKRWFSCHVACRSFMSTTLTTWWWLGCQRCQGTFIAQDIEPCMVPPEYHCGYWVGPWNPAGCSSPGIVAFFCCGHRLSGVPTSCEASKRLVLQTWPVVLRPLCSCPWTLPVERSACHHRLPVCSWCHAVHPSVAWLWSCAVAAQPIWTCKILLLCARGHWKHVLETGCQMSHAVALGWQSAVHLCLWLQGCSIRAQIEREGPLWSFDSSGVHGGAHESCHDTLSVSSPTGDVGNDGWNSWCSNWSQLASCHGWYWPSSFSVGWRLGVGTSEAAYGNLFCLSYCLWSESSLEAVYGGFGAGLSSMVAIAYSSNCPWAGRVRWSHWGGCSQSRGTTVLAFWWCWFDFCFLSSWHYRSSTFGGWTGFDQWILSAGVVGWWSGVGLEPAGWVRDGNCGWAQRGFQCSTTEERCLFSHHSGCHAYGCWTTWPRLECLCHFYGAPAWTAPPWLHHHGWKASHP